MSEIVLPKRFILFGLTQEVACVNWLKNYLHQPHEQKLKLDVNISEYIPDQTDSQRGYFHTMCKVFADAVGESPDAIKWIVKKETFGSEDKNIAGVHIEEVKSTAKGSTNKMEYSELIETLLRLAAFANVYIPEPDKQW